MAPAGARAGERAVTAEDGGEETQPSDIGAAGRDGLDASLSARWHRLTRLGPRVACGVVAFAAAFTLLLDLSRHAVAANSDSATVALEGRAMLHGNLLLNHWTISLDSFWTIDALVNGAWTALLGLGDVLVNVAPASIAVVLIVVGGWIAMLDSARHHGLVAASVVVAILLLPSHALSFFFLQGPWHVGTALWCLFAFLGLRSGRFGLGWIVAVAFLAAGLLGDIQMLALGVVPVFVAGLFATARTRRLRPGLSLLAASPASVLLAFGVREIALSVGTFTFKEAHHTAHLARMEHNLGHLMAWGASLFGVIAGPYRGPHVPVVLELAHLVVLVFVLFALVYAVVLLVRGVVRPVGEASADAPRWRMDDLLLFAAAGDAGVFEVLSLSNNILYARYLTAGLIFSVILAARMTARMLSSSRLRVPVAPLGVLAALLVACLSANVVLELRGAEPPQPAVALVHYLEHHHLTLGVGDYWAASVVTLESGGTVNIRPVVANLHHLIVPDGRQADGSWYLGQHFQFLVFETLPYGRVDEATLTRTFGAPAHLDRVGRYFVATWRHELTLSRPAFP